TDLNLQLDGSLNLFGLDLAFDDLAVAYDPGAGSLAISGGASLSFGPFDGLAVTLPGSGLTIDTTTGAVHVGGLSIAFSVGLGAGGNGGFSFSGSLEFTDTVTNGVEAQDYSAKGTIDTGEGDFTAGMSFTHAGGSTNLDSVS